MYKKINQILSIGTVSAGLIRTNGGLIRINVLILLFRQKQRSHESIQNVSPRLRLRRSWKKSSANVRMKSSKLSFKVWKSIYVKKNTQWIFFHVRGKKYLFQKIPKTPNIKFRDVWNRVLATFYDFNVFFFMLH